MDMARAPLNPKQFQALVREHNKANRPIDPPTLVRERSIKRAAATHGGKSSYLVERERAKYLVIKHGVAGAKTALDMRAALLGG